MIRPEPEKFGTVRCVDMKILREQTSVNGVFFVNDASAPNFKDHAHFISLFGMLHYPFLIVKPEFFLL